MRPEVLERHAGKATLEDMTYSALPWLVLNLGLVPYVQAWDLQARLVQARQQELIGDVLVLLQHPHTYTLGRRATQQHLLIEASSLAQRGVEALWVDRGGDITYHGPGQVTGYPILDLRRRRLDVHRYLRSIEDALIRSLALFGIKAGRDPAFTGVWVEESKIAAIGVKISRGVSSHGFALNVNTDLAFFQDIVPCGIADKGVTSMQRLLGVPQDIFAIQKALAEQFAAVFGGVCQPADLDALLAMCPLVSPASVDPPTRVATL